MDEVHLPDMARVKSFFGFKGPWFTTFLSGSSADRSLETQFTVDAVDFFVVYGMAQAVEFSGDHAIAPGRMFQSQFLEQVYQPFGIFTRDIIEGASRDREALGLDFEFFFGKETFEASVFFFKGFEAFSFGGGKAAIFLPPTVDGLFEDADFRAVRLRSFPEFRLQPGSL